MDLIKSKLESVTLNKSFEPESARKIIEILNFLLDKHDLYFLNPDAFEDVISGLHGEGQDSIKDKTEFPPETTTQQKQRINRYLVHSVFSCFKKKKGVCVYIDNYEKELVFLRDSECYDKEGLINILMAHCFDITPMSFGRHDIWDLHSDNTSLKRPHIILKAHDHGATMSHEGTINQSERYAENEYGRHIPTFEAGENGRYIGELILEVDRSSDDLIYDWHLWDSDFSTTDQGLQVFVNEENPFDSHTLQRPLRPNCQMGGSPTHAGKVYRAVSLYLETLNSMVNCSPVCLSLACPSSIRDDSYYPEDGTKTGRIIDTYDIGNLYGHETSLYLVHIDNIDDLAGSFKPLFNGSMIRSSILPEAKGFVDQEPKIDIETAKLYGIKEEYRGSYRFAPSICIKHNSENYLITFSNNTTRVYDLLIDSGFYSSSIKRANPRVLNIRDFLSEIGCPKYLLMEYFLCNRILPWRSKKCSESHSIHISTVLKDEPYQRYEANNNKILLVNEVFDFLKKVY